MTQQRVQELAGRSDEGEALDVLVEPGRFADDHDLGGRRPVSRDGVRPGRVQAAQCARADPRVQPLELSADQMGFVCAGAPAGFRVWSGDDGFTLPLLAVGGYGVICVTSHLAGRAVKTMIEAYGDGRNGQATEVHHRLLPLINALMTAASNPIPVKTALNRLGFPAGPFRLPLTAMDETTTAKVMKVVEGAGDLVTFKPRVEVA